MKSSSVFVQKNRAQITFMLEISYRKESTGLLNLMLLCLLQNYGKYSMNQGTNINIIYNERCKSTWEMENKIVFFYNKTYRGGLKA